MPIKSLKIKQADGSFGDKIPFGAYAENVTLQNGDNLERFLKGNTTKYFDTFQDVIAATAEVLLPKVESESTLGQTVNVGDTVITGGFHTIGDGGAGIYKIKAATEEEIGALEFNFEGNLTTLRAELIPTIKEISVRQLGAYGDGINDDTAIIQKVIDNNEYVYIPDGIYVVSTINIGEEGSSKKIIRGQSMENTILKANPLNDYSTTMIYMPDHIEAEISNLHLNGALAETLDKTIATDKMSKGVQTYRIDATSNLKFKNILVENFANNGLSVSYCSELNNLKIKNIGYAETAGTGFACATVIQGSHFSDIDISDCNYIGFSVTTAKDCFFNNISVIRCGGMAGSFKNMTTVQFGMYIGNKVTGSTFNNLIIKNNYKTGMYLAGKQNVFNNVIFDTNGTYDHTTDTRYDGAHIYFYYPVNNTFYNAIFANINPYGDLDFSTNSICYVNSETNGGLGNIFYYKIIFDLPTSSSTITANQPNLFKGGFSAGSSATSNNTFIGNSAYLDEHIYELADTNFYNEVTGNILAKFSQDRYIVNGYLTLGKDLAEEDMMMFFPIGKGFTLSGNSSWGNYLILKDVTNKKIYTMRLSQTDLLNQNSSRYIIAGEAIPAGTYEVSIDIPKYFAINTATV